MAATDQLLDGYRAITEGAGLIDRSERGKLALTGGGAKEFLAGQVTNDIEKLEPGHGCYAALLTHKGKMRADLRVLDTGDELLLDTERPALQALFDTIRTFKLGFDVELHKRTVQRTLQSVIGPKAREVTGADAAGLGLEEHDHVAVTFDGHDVRLIATDVGVDVLGLAEDADAIRAALMAAGARETTDDAADVLRVEHGRPRYGVDLDETVIPQEAALNDRAVSFTKGCYVGQETVARLFYKGKPNRHLRGLKLSAPVATGTPLTLGEKTVGQVGTSVVSPVHGPIALAIVRREAEPGAELRAGDATAVVAELPFD
ncbi:MAG: folate-binding protein YgfZ [Solirubrobacteraceae bacterium]|nr:folate-binding protein YgfZ [Solirubrobacteraceae bacterium]